MSIEIENENSTTASAPAPAGDAHSERALYRVAGWGALLAAVSYVMQPVLVFTAYAPVESTNVADQYSDVADLASRTWSGPAEAAIFCGVAVGLLMMTTAVSQLLNRRLRVSPFFEAGVGLQLMTIFGWITGLAWLFAAGLSLVEYSAMTQGLAETGADSSTQKSLILLLNIVLSGALAVGAFALIGWLVGLIVLGRRARVAGWGIVILSSLLLLGLALTAALLSAPFAVLGLIPYLLVLGIVFLVKSRRAVSI